jgi:hypothetical protein
VICCEVLANESLKVNKLIRHLKTKHCSLADRGTEFFKRKAEIVKKTRLDSSGSYQQENATAVEASYLVAQRIAKVKIPHTIAEELILPCAKDIVSVMMGSDYLIKLQPLSSSNDTIRRRIQDMVYYILSQVVDEIKSCPSGMFSIQLDESTDVTHLAQLLVYVRHVYNDDIKLSFCCANLWKLQRLQEIFSKLCQTFSKNTVSSGKTYVQFVGMEPLPCWVADPDFKL